MANTLLIILISLALSLVGIVVGGTFYLGIVWFTVNHRWPWPLDWYFEWVNQKTHDIKAKCEAKRLSDEWREMNEGDWKRGKKS